MSDFKNELEQEVEFINDLISSLDISVSKLPSIAAKMFL